MPRLLPIALASSSGVRGIFSQAQANYRAQAQSLVEALPGRAVEYHHVAASLGHDSFLVEVETMTQLVGGYLQRLGQPQAACDAP